MIEFSPIGYFRGPAKYKADVPRQGTLRADGSGEVELIPGKNYEQALQGLEGFKRIWLIYHTHENTTWKPMVLPQNSSEKIGVFATRSPYRPNGLGLTCVVLVKVLTRSLLVSEFDLVDGTPILDIKPYIPYADAFTEVQALQDGCWWQRADDFAIDWEPLAIEKAQWLEEFCLIDVRGRVRAQLTTQPLDGKRKRVRAGSNGLWILAVRTWRVSFVIDESSRQIRICDISSGYVNSTPVGEVRPWPGRENSLELHQKFAAAFADGMCLDNPSF